MFSATDVSSAKLISQHVSSEQKIKAKKAAHVFLNHVKNGSPKIKNLIREQCKLRIKQARMQRFEQSRTLQNKTFTDFLRAEVADFEKDIEMQDLIFKEIFEETENWFIEELETELQNQEKYLVQISEQVDAFCPICEKSQLKMTKGELKCSCGISFSYNSSLENFGNEIHSIMLEHEMNCGKVLNFYVEPIISEKTPRALNCICFDCDYFRILR